MPLYEFKCLRGHNFDRFLRLTEYDSAQECACGSAAVRQISMVMVAPDLPGYESPASGKWIQGRRQREDDLRRTNSRPYELGERTDMEKRKAAMDAELDSRVERTVGEFVSKLPANKRDELGKSLERHEVTTERR